MLVRLKLTAATSLILGVVFLAGGIAMVATGTSTFQSWMFCLIGALALIGGVVRLAAGRDDVASDRLQRRRRERFGRKR